MENSGNAQITSFVLEYAINGIGPLSSSRALAKKYKDDRSFPNDDARLDALVSWECSKSFTTGVVTSIASLKCLPAGVAANYVAILIIKARLVAAIADINGYDVDSDVVKTSILLALNSGSIGEILKKAGLYLDQEPVATKLKTLPNERLKLMNDSIGQQLVVSAGSFVLSAATNYSDCQNVASEARKIFKQKSWAEIGTAAIEGLRESSPSIKKTFSELSVLIKDFKGFVSDLITKDLITYSEVIGLLIDKKPEDPNFDKAIGCLQTSPGKFTIILAYLDKQGRVIDGYKISSKDICLELKALFAENELVVFS